MPGKDGSGTHGLPLLLLQEAESRLCPREFKGVFITDSDGWHFRGGARMATGLRDLYLVSV